MPHPSGPATAGSPGPAGRGESPRRNSMTPFLIQLLVVLGALVAVVLPLIRSSVKIVQEYERGVLFRLGRLVGPRGPGLFFSVPVIDRIVNIDLRTATMEVPPQGVVTRAKVVQ